MGKEQKHDVTDANMPECERETAQLAADDAYAAMQHLCRSHTDSLVYFGNGQDAMLHKYGHALDYAIWGTEPGELLKSIAADTLGHVELPDGRTVGQVIVVTPQYMQLGAPWFVVHAFGSVGMTSSYTSWTDAHTLSAIRMKDRRSQWNTRKAVTNGSKVSGNRRRGELVH